MPNENVADKIAPRASFMAPVNEADVVDIVRAALSDAAPLQIVGHGSKARLGRYAPVNRILRLDALTGVTLYEPEELVLSARAGTPLREIEALLDANGQQFAFEPMNYAALLGGASDGGSIGGVVAVNASGPRRIKSGAARDHLLGFRCVTGRGEVVKSGGRVMKNVTGFDLSKLVCGSYGTLAVLTEVTFKVLPKPETEETLLVCGLGEETSSRGSARGVANTLRGLVFRHAADRRRAAAAWRQCGGVAARRSVDQRCAAPG